MLLCLVCIYTLNRSIRLALFGIAVPLDEKNMEARPGKRYKQQAQIATAVVSRCAWRGIEVHKFWGSRARGFVEWAFRFNIPGGPKP